VADIEDFDLDRSIEEAWDAFTDRLDEVLSVMDPSSDLVISAEDETPATIRFCVNSPEVVSAHLTTSVEGLGDLGWAAEDAGWKADRNQEDTRELAELTVATMRYIGVLHPVFLHPDQLAEILLPVDEGVAPTPGQYGVVMTTSQRQLDLAVESTLGQWFGHPPMRTADGDVAIRSGSTVVFLRSTPDGEELIVFAALVHDVDGRSRACEVLNDLNVEARYCRFALHRDRVFVQISVPAKPFAPAHLKLALETLSRVADGIDDELATRLGGHTTFPG